MADAADRSRGILTPADRRYLRGEKELTEESERNVRARIRERLYHSILDFQLLWRHLEPRDLEQVFSPEEENTKHRMRPAIQDLLALSILGMQANDDYFPNRIEYAIEQAAFASDRDASPSLIVDEEPLDDPDMILHRLLTGSHGVSYPEFEKALSSPESSPQQLAKLLNRMDFDDEVTPEEVEEYQSELEQASWRPTMPYVVHAEKIWS